jgi:HAD superfamily hydrolase (TIGR01509 family)
MKLSAIIFDLDGTVLADEDEYGEAFNRVLRQFGVETNKAYPHVSGIGVEENWRIFIQKYNLETKKDVYELSQETQNEYLGLLPNVKLKKGFLDFVDCVRKARIKTSLATSNSWHVVEKVFDQFGIESCFDSVTTGEEVHLKKPNPQIFSISAKKLEVSTSECLVIEDSAAGIKAAHAAGMRVVWIKRNNKHSSFPENADLIIDNFEKLSLDKLRSL